MTQSSQLSTSRRDFLKLVGISGGGLVVGASLSGCGPSQPAIQAQANTFTPNAFVQVTADNQVRFYCPRDEMGQGVTTGLATLIAEELDIEPQKITVRFASVHDDYVNPDFGMQGTGGSTSLKVHFEQLRQVGANTRAVLLHAAAQQLGVSLVELDTENGEIKHDESRYPYGDFADLAAQLPIPESAPLKARSAFKYIGYDFARLDAMEKSTGTAVYGIDVDIPNMHHAVVRRCPVAGGALKNFSRQSVIDLPGVTDVLEIDTGIAVVARSFWQAKKAAASLQVEWQTPDLADVSSAKIQADYRQALANEDVDTDASKGNVEAGLNGAAQTINAEYWAPYLAHTPLEPMNAVVRIDGDKADVWSGTQGPSAAQGLVARYAGLDKDNVTVHSTYLGGGFGRRGILTHIVEATQIAVASGKPIQLVWTREDDIKHGFYRPASLMRIQGGIDENGKIVVWQATRVGGNIMPELLKNVMPALLPSMVPVGATDWVAGVSASIFDGWAVDHSSVEGLVEDYDVPNYTVQHITVDHGLPLTFWRSVGHSYTAFAKESAIDELALTANIDPITLRLNNTQNNPRLNQVIRQVAERMPPQPLGEERQWGFAAHASFGSYVAQAAEVSVTDGQIKVHRVICGVDCGQVVNPDIVRGQMEGAIMFGLTAALHGEIELENGEVKQSNFHDYPILRMDEAPQVETILIESDESPTGVGEPGLPPIAPAVANAVFALTGERLRALPLRLS